MGGGQTVQFLRLLLGLECQPIGPLLLLEAPGAQAGQGGQQGQSRGGQQAPGGALPFGTATALGLPAEVVGQSGQFGAGYGGGIGGAGGHGNHGAEAQQVAEFRPQQDILGGFEAPGGIRPGHVRLLKG